MATPEDPIVIFHGGDVTLLYGEANYSPTPSPFCLQPTGPTPASLTPASQTPANSVRASQTPARSNRASPNPTSSIPVSPHHTSSDEPTVPTSSLGLDQILGGKSPSINEPTSSQYPSQTTGDSLVSSEIPRGRSLVVASHVLSLSSRAFKATLKPGFQTGVQFAEDGKITVRMAEDSGKAMTVICNIIHGCDAWIPTEVSTSHLHEIAVLSDKYDFNQALEPTVTTWVRDYVSDLGENPTRQSRIDTWMNVLFSAYLFRHQQLAHKAMEGLVLCSYLTKRDLDTKRYRIPDRLLQHLKINQFDACVEMQKVVSKPVASLTKRQAEREPLCATLIQQTKALMDDLCDNGFLSGHLTDDFEIEEKLTYLEELDNKYIGVPNAHSDYGRDCTLATGLCECQDGFSPNSIVDQIREKIVELRASLFNRTPINF